MTKTSKTSSAGVLLYNPCDHAVVRQRYRIVVSYLGTPFRGWQLQNKGATVQGEVERALRTMLGGDRVVVVGTGRTDTGVHAAGQLAHFDLPVEIPARGMLKSLNGRLPETIRIRRVDLVPSTFHAQKSARAKLYSYRIRWMDCPTAPPWITLRSAILRRPKDLQDLRSGLEMFQGVHDWASFSVTYPKVIRTQRRVFDSAIRESRWGIRIDLKGEGFLRYQVRRMVGALFQVAWRQHDLDWFEDLMARPTPGSAVFNAPARGLTLEKVYMRTPSVEAKNKR